MAETKEQATELSQVQKSFIDGLTKEIKKSGYTEEYTVKPGDTLGGIANRCGLEGDYKKLESLNNILGVKLSKREGKRIIYNLKIGQKIIIPKADKLAEVKEIFEKIDEVYNDMKVNSSLIKLETQFTTGFSKKELKKVNREIRSILRENNESIFPNQVVSQGFDFLLAGYGAKSSLESDNENPKTLNSNKVMEGNTHSELEAVVCARLIRMLMKSGFNKNDLIPEQRKFFNDSNIDARMMVDRVSEIGFGSRFNLTNFFDENLIGENNPMKQSELGNYHNSLSEVGTFLENEAQVGTMLPLYFSESSSKNEVKDYNSKKEEKQYNTHMAMFVGNRVKDFKANEISTLTTKNFTIPRNGVSLQKYLEMFINSRRDFKSNLNITSEMLKRYSSLIHFYKDGTKIEINDDNLKTIIKGSDNIKIEGPMLVDGLHLKNSPDPQKREEMNARTRFYWEFIIADEFFLSRVVEPEKDKWPKVKDDISIGNVKKKFDYFLKPGDSVEDVLKKQIIENEKLKADDTNGIQKQYDLQIKGLKMFGFMKNENILNPGAFDVNRAIPYFDTTNIDEIYKNYITEKRNEQKIKELNESSLFREYISLTTNPGDNYGTIWRNMVNDTKDFLNVESINYKKQRLSNMSDLGDYISSIGVLLVNSGLETKYPNLKELENLTDLQKRMLVKELLITQVSSFPKAKQEKMSQEFMSGKITEGFSFILSFKKLDETITKVKKDSGIGNIDKMEISKSDDLAIKLASEENIWLQKQLENQLYQESYTHSEGGARITKKIIGEQFPETSYWGSYVKNIFTEFEFKGEKINSRGDGQIRLSLSEDNNEWITVEQLYKALHKLETKDFLDFVGENPRMKLKIESDLEIVKNIKNNLLSYTKDKKQETLDLVVEDLKKLITIDGHTSLWKVMGVQFPDKVKEHINLDDDYGNNVVGKVIGMSLAGDKLKGHTTKLKGILQNVGEEPINHYNNNLKSYDNVVSMMNNLGERKAVLIMTENYIIRILEALEIKMDYPQIQENKNSQMIYGENTFKEHLNLYINSISNKSIKAKLQNILNPKSGNNTYGEIYNFISDPEIKDILQKDGKNTSFLPTSDEFIGVGVQTRQKLFRYVNSRSGEKVPPSEIKPFSTYIKNNFMTDVPSSESIDIISP